VVVTLERLVEELRVNAESDLQFAQRVALVCCKLVEDKADPLAAIRLTFRLE
jgi:hypothetical protein